MHCNYHFFKQLVPVLAQKLIGKKLLACFSQEKDELILGFANAEAEFYIKCVVASTFGGLYFPEVFHRARHNSIDLFGYMLNATVKNVFVFENERAIGIKFKNNYHLVFKLYGNRSNVLVFKEEEVKAIFNHRLKDDMTLKLPDLHRKLSQTKEAFIEQNENPNAVYPTWGKLPKSVYDQEKSENTEQNWQLSQQINEKLESGNFYIVNFKDELHLSLLETGEILRTFTDPIAANNAFFIEKQKTSQFDLEKNAALKRLSKGIKQTESYLKKTEQRLDEVLSGPGNQEIGHLIMAYAHQIPEKAEQVILNDFTTGKPLEIRLKSKLSPQKNAESYYRKAKKEKVEQDILFNNIEKKTAELEALKKQIEQINAVENLRELRGLFKTEKIERKKTKRPNPEDLFKVFTCNGFQIYVGKNSKNNDLLTLKYSHKNDTWLHAKDVSGSHVVIKQIPGQNIPKNVLEKAAGLAAWFSKRRTDSFVPVSFTPKKFVRKIKGSPDGSVMVDKEETILVEPIDPSVF